jgi:hypothetical protein
MFGRNLNPASLFFTKAASVPSNPVSGEGWYIPRGWLVGVQTEVKYYWFYCLRYETKAFNIKIIKRDQ